ncbi:MAG TPA: hypothetical protein VHV30_05900 [Polyangiaceae bacterium]|jgi:hypothetical protein|nr:hypothetical protein [Polyangiaceae bacterium]
MMTLLGSSCCVCGARDARALVDVVLIGGARTTLCGSHELMHRRSPAQARTVAQLRALLGDRRSRSDRRDAVAGFDDLAVALSAAFSGDQRVADRRL